MAGGAAAPARGRLAGSWASGIFLPQALAWGRKIQPEPACPHLRLSRLHRWCGTAVLHLGGSAAPKAALCLRSEAGGCVCWSWGAEMGLGGGGWEGGAGRSQQRGRRARWVGGQRAHPSYTRRLVRRWMQSAAASSAEHCCLSPLLCNTPRAPISKQPPSPARDGEPQPVAGLSGGGGGGGELCTPGAARRGEHRVGAGNAQSASAWLPRAPRPQLGDTETGGSGVPTPSIPSKPTLP